MDAGIVILFWGFFILTLGCFIADYAGPKLVQYVEKRRLKRVVDLVIRVTQCNDANKHRFVYSSTISACIPYATQEWLDEHMVQIMTSIDSRCHDFAESWIILDEYDGVDAFDVYYLT